VVTLLASPGSAANTTPAVPSHRPAATAPVPRTPAPSPSGTAGSGAAPAPAPITLAFAGDVHFADHLGPLLRSDDSLAAVRPYLAGADVAVVNLETAITDRGTPQPKEFHFRTTPAALRVLGATGVDVVTMANNHAVDYGLVGLGDTLAARRAAPIGVVGIGANAADAYAPAVVTVKGRRVAVIGASQLGDWTLQHFTAGARTPGIASAVPIGPLVAAVRAARRQADVVVVYLHWGTERMTCPQASQRDAARALAAAGADVVIGSHPHVTQGAGYLGTTFVDYSMGNFVWYSRGSEASISTGVLTLTVTGRQVTASRWTPLRIGADGVPRPPSSAVGARMTRDWQAARACTGLSARPS